MTPVDHAVRRVSLPTSATAARTARVELAAFLDECGVSPGVIDDAVVIISELVTNAVRHAASGLGGKLRMECNVDLSQLRLQVSDGGRHTRLSLHEQGAVGGRGLSIVAALADSWSLEREERGTTATAFLSVA